MSVQKIFYFLAILVVLTGCQKIFNKPDDVAKLDIADAQYLGVDESADFSQGAGNSLVKIRKGDALDNWQTAERNHCRRLPLPGKRFRNGKEHAFRAG